MLIRFSNKLRSMVKRDVERTIVLTDGDDERTLEAACEISRLGITSLLLLSEDQITSSDVLNQSHVICMTKEQFQKRFQPLINKYQSLGVNFNVQNLLPYYGAILVKEGIVEGMVGGASTPTADVLRAGLKIIGLNEGISLVSSSLVMDIPSWNRPMYLADCAVVPRPTSEQLGEIAISTVRTAKSLGESSIYVAMLSYSTKGSAEGEEVFKVRKATQNAIDRAKKWTNVFIDGELQLDAAILPDIAKRKAPGSPVAGKANVLIFPDLNSGNITYKAIERFAGARAIGVIINGFKHPINDLSRGCSIDDIIDLVCVTALQVSEEINRFSD